MVKKKQKSKSYKRAANNQPCISTAINNEVIAEALSSINQPTLLKVCRLCESKDGPFLNIFDPDKVTSKKIEDLMPFEISENDDLPHKICFRCSAKVVELHEFIQKCSNTQNSLRAAIGRKGPVPLKTKTRKIWEQKLNKSNMSNDDICDALIKKAMESIKDIPLNPVPDEELPPIPNKPEITIKPAPLKKDDNEDVPVKELALDKAEDRKTRSSLRPKTESIEEAKTNVEINTRRPQRAAAQKKKQTFSDSGSESDIEDTTPISNIPKITTPKEPEPPKPQELPPPTFNIMDHVSKITVNGVGILFQCKLCNRNFLKKDVVLSHECAKKGKPKVDFTKHIAPPEPPKVPTVKYIKMDTDFRKSLSNDGKVNVRNDSRVKSIPEDKEEKKIPILESKPKPKAGPASKMKRKVDDLSATIGMTVRPREPSPEQVVSTPPQPTPPPVQPIPTPQPTPAANSTFTMPSLNIPGLPNTSFRLVLGPNNTLTLVADKPETLETPTVTPEAETQQKARKRKSDDPKLVDQKIRNHGESSKSARKSSSPEVVEIDETLSSKPKSNQPYPVGLFQTVSHHSSMYVPPVPVEKPTVTTPAMKKQSYKVVQTGNLNKLVISTKAQPVEEVTKKRQRKSKQEVRPDFEPKQPYSVTLEDANHQKDPGFFTFINVDPLLQPSYVLPTDNIIQESQITTSTPAAKNATDTKDKYSCNMCEEKFSREKKLLAHIQSHFTKMDAEDQEREKINKKRGRK